MHIDPYIVLGSAIVGLLVGMTGAGGGALMTPMLIFFFSITPSKAISSDLVAAVFMRPPAAIVHWTKKTINWKLVGLMACGSVPMAILGTFLLKQLTIGKSDVTNIEKVLGAALLLGAAAMVVRYVIDKRSGTVKSDDVNSITVRAIPTILVGAIGGIIVGMTSVGSGSLMIVFLLFLYPVLSAKHLVGTDLSQAVPLTIAAAIGTLIFGHATFPVTAAIVIGSVPAAIAGSFLSSRAPDKYIRPAIALVILISGLKYIGLDNTDLVWSGAIAIVAGALGVMVVSKYLASVPAKPEMATVGAAETSS